ncbi:hypothetical protein ACO34A_00840 [Rhizobium sp. ACO-34A]|nr:methyl-accepting chemotaxis protein [Rhizobium sp. ACO-34A]ATN32358.1 hypothetical protein ACO34A_00840 [Rhizobium sp. ACO-34A]
MQHARLSHDFAASTTGTISTDLEQARTAIEKRFLEGGTILLSVLEAIDKLAATLDAVTGALDGDSAEATGRELKATMTELSALPDRESRRQSALATISSIEKGLRDKVVAMRETLRYLRTFAITAKITGAGIEDFAGFAEEIIERIQYGASQVDKFAETLDQLGKRLDPAAARGREILQQFETVVPGIVKDLAQSSELLTEQHRTLGATAQRVRKLAGGVQMKLATVLSAMQIGDISRQRIEHCQSAFAILGDYLETGEGRSLSEDQKNRLSLVITCLVARQLEQTSGDFGRDTTKIVNTMGSFSGDIGEMLSLRDLMAGNGESGNSRAIRQLEQNVAAAQQIVTTVEAASLEATDLSRSTAELVGKLVSGIEIVRVVRTDIQYMALNTNLRCSRIGEEGRAINVVTAELRNFAGQMDETAEAILTALHALQEAAAEMAEGTDGSGGDANLGQRLHSAASRIHDAGDSMEKDLAHLGEDGREAAERMEKAMVQLDYKAELGDILERCADEIAEAAQGAQPDLSDLGPAIEVIGSQIYRTYTMVAEREIHAAVLPLPATAAAPVAAASSADDDEDLFESALF